MSTPQHDEEVLGAYALGALDAARAREVEAHLASCPSCREEAEQLREMALALGQLPPEVLVDGRPEGGDLLLQRTLRQARTERTGGRRRRTAVLAAAVAAAVVAVFFGGYLTSGDDSPQAQVRPTGSPTPTGSPAPTGQTGTPEGVLTASATDPATRARMAVRITPAVGWIRLNAAVSGIPAGERCTLVVVTRSGGQEIAGSWVVGRTPAGGGKPADIDGSAAVAAGDVSSVVVQTEGGKKYVTVPV